MKKNYYFILLALTILGCQKDASFVDNKDNLSHRANKEVINGRFHFSSINELTLAVETVRDNSFSENEKEFEPYYLQGFLPLEPIVNENNDALIQSMSNSYLSKKPLADKYLSRTSKYEEFDNEPEFDEEFDEKLIADPNFAAYLNTEREIVVNDTLYKYTSDGLFFSHLKDSLKLFDFLDKRFTNTTQRIVSPIEPCQLRAQNGGVRLIDEGLYQFVAPLSRIQEDCDVYNPPTTPPITPPKSPNNNSIDNVIKNLPVCGGRSGHLINNIFGKNYYCYDYWDKRHRIKLEFWEGDYHIYKSVGSLAKTQTRRLRIWWASKSDEIALGINYVYMKIRVPAPDYQVHNHAVNQFKAPLFLYRSEVYTKVGSGSFNYGYQKTQIKMVKNKLPFFDFENSDIFNIYIPNLPIIGDFNLDVNTNTFLTENNIKNLYSMGTDFLRKNIVSNKRNKFAIIFQINPQEIEVIYFDEMYHRTNENKIKKRFYNDIYFQLGTNFNDNLNGGFNYRIHFVPEKDIFLNFSDFKLDFYGVARKGSHWKGVRMQMNTN